MCGSVQPRQQPVYTPPAACPPQAPKAPAQCAPVVDTFTPPPPPVVSPEKATPVAPQVASPERPTIQSAPNADAPAACNANKQCAPCEEQGLKKGLAKLLGMLTAVFSFLSLFMRAQPKVEAQARDDDNARNGQCARNWRDFEGRRDNNRVIAPERDAIRPQQAFTPSSGVRC